MDLEAVKEGQQIEIGDVSEGDNGENERRENAEYAKNRVSHPLRSGSLAWLRLRLSRGHFCCNAT
jgi:hypothetical protein